MTHPLRLTRLRSAPAPAALRATASDESGRLAHDTEFDVAILLKPQASVEEIEQALNHNEQLLPLERRGNGRDVLALLRAPQSHVELVEKFAKDYGLVVGSTSPEGHRMLLRGRAAQIERAFGIRLHRRQVHGVERHFHDEPFSLPEEIDAVVEAVLGLHSLPLDLHPFMPRARQSGFVSRFEAVPASEIANWYRFPAGLAGDGQRIAVLQFGPRFHPQDIHSYFAHHKLPLPKINEHFVSNASAPGLFQMPASFVEFWNSPSASIVDMMAEMTPPVFDQAMGLLEVTLDVQLLGTLANGATIDIYYADYTALGMSAAIEQALAGEPAAISISWGSAENFWADNCLAGIDASLRLARAKGITIFCAAGDGGSRGYFTDEEADGTAHVMFPASSPHVVGCGGTQILRKNDGTFYGEQVWSDLRFHQSAVASGGGVSGFFPRPAYQDSARVPSLRQIDGRVWVADRWQHQADYQGRGVPDVAASAGLQTAYDMIVGGQHTFGGGTSAAAPLWAALTGLLAQGLGVPTGWMQAPIYRLAKDGPLVPVTKGSNRVSDQVVGFEARAGWNPCVGWGRPDGSALLDSLRGARTMRRAQPGSRRPPARTKTAKARRR